MIFYSKCPSSFTWVFLLTLCSFLFIRVFNYKCLYEYLYKYKYLNLSIMNVFKFSP